MNREQKRAVVAARALSDTSKPPPLPPPLLSAAAALWIERNAKTALDVSLVNLAELFEGTDAECTARRAQAKVSRSNLSGECFGPPAMLSLEKRHLVLSSMARQMADERAAPPRGVTEPSLARKYVAGAVFETTYTLLAAVCTAPFMGCLLREHPEWLEYSSDRALRMERGQFVYRLICEWEGDDAAAAFVSTASNPTRVPSLPAKCDSPRLTART